VILRIKIQDYTAVVNVHDDRINLKGGAYCKYTDTHCTVDELGVVVWVPDHLKECSTDVSVIYGGNANIVTAPDALRTANETYVVIDDSKNERLFALRLVAPTFLCSHPVIQTEHPALYMYRPRDNGYFFRNSSLHPYDNNLQAHINSQFMYVEITHKQALQSLNKNAVYRRCLLEQVLMNRLELARLSPDSTARLILKKPGVQGVISGEVMHVVSCEQVLVQVRQTDRCYHELPIEYVNKSVFFNAYHPHYC